MEDWPVIDPPAVVQGARIGRAGVLTWPVGRKASAGLSLLCRTSSTAFRHGIRAIGKNVVPEARYDDAPPPRREARQSRLQVEEHQPT